MLSLLSSLLGFGASFLPKIMDYFQDRQDHRQELAIMDKQLEVEKVRGNIKLEMVNVDADIAETKNLLRHDAKLQAKASQWVTNLAASVRPVISYLFFIEFFGLTVCVNMGWIDMGHYRQIWDEPTQAMFAAVVSFWFGSRSFNRKSHT